MAAQPVDETVTNDCPAPANRRRAASRRKPLPMDPRRAPEGIAAGPPSDAHLDGIAKAPAETESDGGNEHADGVPTGIARGIEVIRAALKTMPTTPGGYR